MPIKVYGLIISGILILGIIIWVGYTIHSMTNQLNTLKIDSMVLSSSVDELSKQNKELLDLNKKLVQLASTKVEIQTERKVFVDRVKEIKVTEASQLNSLQMELDSQWENLP